MPSKRRTPMRTLDRDQFDPYLTHAEHEAGLERRVGQMERRRKFVITAESLGKAAARRVRVGDPASEDAQP